MTKLPDFTIWKYVGERYYITGGPFFSHAEAQKTIERFERLNDVKEAPSRHERKDKGYVTRLEHKLAIYTDPYLRTRELVPNLDNIHYSADYKQRCACCGKSVKDHKIPTLRRHLSTISRIIEKQPETAHHA